MQEIKDVALFLVAGFAALVSWIFRASQKSQDERIVAIEAKQVKFEDRMIELTIDIAGQFNSQREDRRKDLDQMNVRNDKAHEAIVTRLDTLINGKK